MIYGAKVFDPRDRSCEQTLIVEYFATPASRGLELDAEFEIDRAVDDDGQNVFPHLTCAQQSEVIDDIRMEHEFDV